MLSNSLIKYFKGLNERSNQISTLLFINTESQFQIRPKRRTAAPQGRQVPV